MKKPTYATVIFVALMSTGAGLLVTLVPWSYAPLLSSILLALGAGGLALIFFQLLVQLYCGRRKG